MLAQESGIPRLWWWLTLAWASGDTPVLGVVYAGL